MSPADTGAAAILRKLIFGTRAEVRDAAAAVADRGRAPPPTAALPRAVSGGEDFHTNDSET